MQELLAAVDKYKTAELKGYYIKVLKFTHYTSAPSRACRGGSSASR
jgi:hypothetical protein